MARRAPAAAPSQWRIVLVGVLLASLWFLLLIRLADVQLVRGEYFAQLADNNRFHELRSLAARGLFLDRYQQPLVANKKSYYQLVDHEQIYSERKPISHDEALSLIISDETQIESEQYRKYLFPEAMAHALGYVGKVTAEELLEQPLWPLNKLIGKAGLEQLFNEQLKGYDGRVLYEINALGERQRVVGEYTPVPGDNIFTSLDPYISTVAYRALAGQKGAVIVSDVKTGQILTLVSSPSYDPNIFSQPPPAGVDNRIRTDQIRQVFSDPDQPFFNRAIAGNYAPGSTFKLVTALAGLEGGTINENTTVVDEGVLKVGEFEYGNWYFRQHGKVEGEIGLVRSIARSNDIFFYKVAEWTGPNRLAEMAELFGFGRPPTIELQPVAGGTVPTPSWKERVIGEKWYLGNTYHLGIGQGDLLVSPLQVQQMTQAIANQGELCDSTILSYQDRNCQQVGLQARHLEIVIQGMIQACSPGGTAFPFFPRNGQIIEEYGSESVTTLLEHGAVACKTGTAEFGAADFRGYRPTHGWFTLFVQPQLESGPGASDLTVTSETETETETEGGVSGEDGFLESKPIDLSSSQYQRWLARSRDNFPEEIAITVLMESDEQNLYREGSGDAGPVAKAILDWIEGRQVNFETVTENESLPGFNE